MAIRGILKPICFELTETFDYRGFFFPKFQNLVKIQSNVNLLDNPPVEPRSSNLSYHEKFHHFFTVVLTLLC